MAPPPPPPEALARDPAKEVNEVQANSTLVNFVQSGSSEDLGAQVEFEKQDLLLRVMSKSQFIIVCSEDLCIIAISQLATIMTFNGVAYLKLLVWILIGLV